MSENFSDAYQVKEVVKMKVKIHGKNKFEVKPKLRSYIESQVGGIAGMLRNTDDIMANVVCKEYGDNKVVEITIPTKYLILRAETSANDMFLATDLAVAKIEKQLLKHKKKINSLMRGRDGVAEYFSQKVEEMDTVEEDGHLVKQKEVDLEIMSVDEAMLQLDLL